MSLKTNNQNATANYIFCNIRYWFDFCILHYITLHYKLFLYADFANSVHKYNKITHVKCIKH
jgi:hypothetical protein